MPNERAAAVVDSGISSSDHDENGTTILLGLARDAIRDGRLVAPAGNNAYEFYLSVLQLQPDNQTAQDALRESFPEAAERIEHAINQQDLEGRGGKSICFVSSTATTSPSPCAAASCLLRARC